MHTFIIAGQSGMMAQYDQPGTLPAEYETGIDQLQMWDEGSWKRLGLGLSNGNVVPRYGPAFAFAWTMHAACPDSNIGIIKQGAADMNNRAQAESWGEKYLSIVDAYRGDPNVPDDLPLIHGTPRVGDFPDDIPIGADGTHSTPEGIRLTGRLFAKTYANEVN